MTSMHLGNKRLKIELNKPTTLGLLNRRLKFLLKFFQ